jgi:hypothetical protein
MTAGSAGRPGAAPLELDHMAGLGGMPTAGHGASSAPFVHGWPSLHLAPGLDSHLASGGGNAGFVVASILGTAQAVSLEGL